MEAYAHGASGPLPKPTLCETRRAGGAPPSRGREGMKVILEIFEIPPRSILGVHTGTILIRHYNQIHSSPRKITHTARDGNVAQTRNGGYGLKQVARPALGTREFRFLQFVHIPNDITGALAAHSCCLCRPPLLLGGYKPNAWHTRTCCSSFTVKSLTFLSAVF